MFTKSHPTSGTELGERSARADINDYFMRYYNWHRPHGANEGLPRTWPKINLTLCPRLLDHYNVDLALPSARIIRASEQVIELRGKPVAIRCYNGPELISGPLIAWATKNRITLLYIQPGKRTQNAYIKRFNRTARHEWLDMHLFHSVAQPQLLDTQWLWNFNNDRPNTGISGIPLRWFLKAA